MMDPPVTMRFTAQVLVSLPTDDLRFVPQRFTGDQWFDGAVVTRWPGGWSMMYVWDALMAYTMWLFTHVNCDCGWVHDLDRLAHLICNDAGARVPEGFMSTFENYHDPFHVWSHPQVESQVTFWKRLPSFWMSSLLPTKFHDAAVLRLARVWTFNDASLRCSESIDVSGSERSLPPFRSHLMTPEGTWEFQHVAWFCG